jgi:hypothetical protein
MVVSCGDSGERGWRTELDLGSRKSLDDHHAAAGLRAIHAAERETHASTIIQTIVMAWIW